MNDFMDDYEIDLKDLFIEWIQNYKGILTILIVDVVLVVLGFIFKFSKTAIIIAVVLLFLHAFLIVVRYMMDKTIKHSDEVGKYLGIPELVHVVNWKKVKGKIGLWRLSREKKISFEEANQINAVAIQNLATEKGLSKVGVIYFDLHTEAKKLMDAVVADNSNLSIEGIKGVSFDVTGMKEIEKCQGVVILAKARHTTWDELNREISLLKLQKKEILGIILYY